MGRDMVLRALLVDDEPFARNDLREALLEHGDLEVVGEAGSVGEALPLVRSRAPEVLFLDVQLLDGDGFELLEQLDERTSVIFLSAHDRYAVRAFEVNALDYLLKPVSRHRLALSLDRLTRQRALHDSEPPSLSRLDPKDRVLVRSEGRRELVALAQVAAVTSLGGNYTQLRRIGGPPLESRRTIKEWESLLPEAGFVRVHRAAIVNVAHLERVARAPGGALTLRLRDGGPLIINEIRLRKGAARIQPRGGLPVQ